MVKELEARANDNPSALSSKCPCIVTQPDVEKAVYLWVKQMEAKGEVVNGPMLVAFLIFTSIVLSIDKDSM